MDSGRERSSAPPFLPTSLGWTSLALPATQDCEATLGEHLYTYIDPPNERHLERVVSHLRSDGVIALPAGTSWMFCADPTSRRAMARIRQLKPMHPKEQPFSMICSSISMATEVARVDADAFRLLNRICPGHYTILLRSSKSLPKLLKNKRAVVGVRIPAEPLALAVVDAFEQPLMATSVPSREDGSLLTMGFEVQERHGHGLEMVLDLGDELIGEPTTILDLTGAEVEVVRAAAGDTSFL